MAAIADMTDEELMSRSRDLRTGILAARDERIAIDKELAFRGAQTARLKALEGLSKGDVDRLIGLAQKVGAKGVPSGEKVGKTASKG